MGGTYGCSQTAAQKVGKGYEAGARYINALPDEVGMRYLEFLLDEEQG